MTPIDFLAAFFIIIIVVGLAIPIRNLILIFRAEKYEVSDYQKDEPEYRKEGKDVGNNP